MWGWEGEKGERSHIGADGMIGQVCFKSQCHGQLGKTREDGGGGQATLDYKSCKVIQFMPREDEIFSCQHVGTEKADKTQQL